MYLSGGLHFIYLKWKMIRISVYKLQIS